MTRVPRPSGWHWIANPLGQDPYNTIVTGYLYDPTAFTLTEMRAKLQELADQNLITAPEANLRLVPEHSDLVDDVFNFSKMPPL